jgi:hypothetical protein
VLLNRLYRHDLGRHVVPRWFIRGVKFEFRGLVWKQVGKPAEELLRNLGRDLS